MVKQHKNVLFVVFCLMPSLGFAQISDKSLNKLMNLSGLTVEVGQFPGLMKEGVSLAKQRGLLNH